MPLDLLNVLFITVFVLYSWPRTIKGYRIDKTPTKCSNRLYCQTKSTNQQTHCSISPQSRDKKDGMDSKRKNDGSGMESLSYDLLSQLHFKAFEVREFQLHLPPIAHVPPVLNKSLTRGDVYDELKGTKESNGKDSSAYMDGPVDVIEMAYKDRSKEFRHCTHGISMKPGKSVLYTWLLERPADVFILNWSGLVTMGCREYIVIAARVLLNLSSVDVSRSKDLLEKIAKNDIPIWLHERCRYAMAYMKEPTDWIALLNYFTRDLDKVEAIQKGVKPPKVDESEGALEFIKKYTRNGDPYNLVDYLGTVRYKLGVKENEMHNWRTKKTNDDEPIYEREFRALGAFKDELKKMFEKERKELRSDYKNWKNLIMYRTNCAHLPESQKIHHEAFNNAIVESINHHTQFFKMPVYLISDTETSSEIRHQMEALNVSATPLIKVLGSDSGTAHKSVNEICSSLKIDERIPIHYFDDRLHNLVSVLRDQRLERVRTYFVDWGRSVYEEKLGALYNDGIKYIKTSKNLVEFMCKFTTFRGREWTHGYRVVFPDEEHIDYMVKWKEKWHTDGSSPGTRTIPVI